jgi:serine-type D-Ala-D-Ala carboxypeptidase/endopeptidase
MHFRPLCLGLALSLLSGSALAIESAEMEQLARQRLEGDRSGACVAVAVVDAAVSRAFVCADAAQDGRIGAESAFEIGSVAKTMAATLLADLILQGQASLDDPLAKHLPEGSVVPEFEGQPIRLRHLVTHSAGLPSLPPGYQPASMDDPYAGLDADTVLSALADVRLAHAPGQAFAYSNFAMMLLSLAVAQIAGEDYDRLLASRLLRPLGMSGAAVNAADVQHPAQGHLPGGRPTPAWTAPGAIAGFGVLYASLDDMVAYAQAQLGRVDTPLAAAIALSQEPVDAAPRPMAMNWLLAPLNGAQIHAHEGGSGGFSSFFAFDRAAGRAVIVLSDTAMTSLGGLSSLGLHLLDRRVPLGAPRRVASPPADLVQGLAGRYQLPGGLGMSLREVDGGLELKADGQPAFALAYDSAGDFFPLAFDALLTPKRAAGGAWTFDWTQAGARNAAQRLDTAATAPVAPEAADLSEYVGVYRLAPQFAIEFSLRKGVLHAQGTGQQALPLDYAGVDTFVMPQVGAEMQFERDAQGRILAMLLKQRGAVQRAVRQ